jgi:hypothetical protein
MAVSGVWHHFKKLLGEARSERREQRQRHALLKAVLRSVSQHAAIAAADIAGSRLPPGEIAAHEGVLSSIETTQAQRPWQALSTICRRPVRPGTHATS